MNFLTTFFNFYRGLYIIDEEGIIRQQIVNDLPIGRSVDEVIRLIKALKFHQEHGDVCPANWKEGQASVFLIITSSFRLFRIL